MTSDLEKEPSDHDDRSEGGDLASGGQGESESMTSDLEKEPSDHDDRSEGGDLASVEDSVEILG